jgi:hypothetical protein
MAARWAFLSLLVGSIFLQAWRSRADEPAATNDGMAWNDVRFVGWASGVKDLVRGPRDIAKPNGPKAFFGVAENALGAAGSPSDHDKPDRCVVSLGDGGWITVGFDIAIRDGDGPDFVVFENGFTQNADKPTGFFELAFVEVSSDGEHFVRFPAVSETQTDTQIGAYEPLDSTKLKNLAGVHAAGFGTKFDLADLKAVPEADKLDLQHIRYVRIVDVIGSIDPALGTRDSKGRFINDPYATDSTGGGFDLDAVGILYRGTEK